MEWILLSVVLLGLLLGIYFFVQKKNKKKVEVFTEEKDESPEIREGEWKVIEEYEFEISGVHENAKKTSRNRQMLLMDMNSYDEVILQLDHEYSNGSIMVLNTQGYDLGYLCEEDKNLIFPYINKEKYKIESGVERFYKGEKGENLIIYLTLFEYID